MMANLELIILLIFVASLFIGLAQKMNVPYPIALVIGGTAIGFIPGMPPIYFDPSLILLLVLPPILYYAAFGISFQEFKKEFGRIFSLSLGLVIFTTLIIGIIFKWIFPEYSWALAFTFGAIISPPDAIAATTILKRLSIKSRLLTLLEGESLVNDATALVLYKLTVTALLSGHFSLPTAATDFSIMVVGGILVGLVTGFCLQKFSRRFLDPVPAIVFSITIPYITYILADYLGVSGVLAVVVNGLIGSRILMTHTSSKRRILGFAVWDFFTILINCFVFVLIGTQLRALTGSMTTGQIILYTGYGVIIFISMIIVRMIWVYSRSIIFYISALKHPGAKKLCAEIMREAVIIGWSGMRGIVSLAAALALPYMLADGSPFKERNEVIFLTFTVILFTLLIPGFTLSLLIRWLKIPQESNEHQVINIRKELSQVADKVLEELKSDQEVDEEEFNFLKAYFGFQHRLLDIASHSKHAFLSYELHDVERTRKKIIRAQRQHLIEMWNRHEIDDKLLIHLVYELDLEETKMSRVVI